jgi:hypothetical protein
MQSEDAMCLISDRFLSAVRTLTGEGPIKQRLVGAYQEYLEDVREEELPDSIRGKFESLRQALTSVEPANGESAVHASVRKMSPVDAQRFATSILLMLAELVRVKGSGERVAFVKVSRPVVETEVQQVPGVIQLRNTGA